MKRSALPFALRSTTPRLLALVLACILAFATATALAGCNAVAGTSSEASESSGEAADAKPDPLDPSVRAQIEQAMAKARENDYDNVTFVMETQTTATGVQDGKTVQQAIRTSMAGELDQDDKDPRVHFAYESVSSMDLGKVAYDMFIDKDRILIEQDGELYGSGIEGATPESYIQSIVGVASEEEVALLLDVASGYKIETVDRTGDTAITITADVSKLQEAGLVDMSALPESTSIATMVANYIISDDDHFKTVRLMSSTTGSPTYRVNQTYNFSKYDETKLPKWPSLADLAAKDPRIQTDEDGQRFIVGDDGEKYYIDSIDDDGTINLHTTQPAQEQPEQETVITYDNPSTSGSSTKQRQSTGTSASTSGSKSKNSTVVDEGASIDKPVFVEADTASDSSTAANTSSTATTGSDTGGSSTTTGSTSTTTENSTGSATESESGNAESETSDDSDDENLGRAYITGYDGVVHYLDEPGSEIRDLGGTRVFIDASGEWYFLSE